MTEVEFLRRELERQLKAVDDLNKMVKDLSQITFESKMDKWLKASKAKEWVELTEYEIKGVLGLSESWEGEDCSIPDMIGFAKAIDAKLKEKNNE